MRITVPSAALAAAVIPCRVIVIFRVNAITAQHANTVGHILVGTSEAAKLTLSVRHKRRRIFPMNTIISARFAVIRELIEAFLMRALPTAKQAATTLHIAFVCAFPAAKKTSAVDN